MRMWLVDPKKLCRKHLLGEHVEMHMFASFINNNKGIQGFLDKGLVATDKIVERHDILARELIDRGYHHQSPIEMKPIEKRGYVDIQENEKELCRRCEKCKELIITKENI